MKLLPIFVLVIVMVLVACSGCMDDLSTKGWCSGTKTSIVHVDTSATLIISSYYTAYFVDSDGVRYVLYGETADSDMRYDGHNITFTYYSDNGRMRIGKILADHTTFQQYQSPCCTVPIPTPAPCQTPLPCGCGG